MRESRNVGPSGLAAGLIDDVETSKADRLSTDQLEPLLAEFRATGQPAVAAQIQKGLRHIGYAILDSVRTRPGIAWEDLIGTLFLDLATFVERLKCNVFTAEEIPGKLAIDLKHSATHYMAESSRNILPKRSTNSMRKKRMVAPHPGIKRNTLEPIKTETGETMNQTIDEVDARPLNQHNDIWNDTLDGDLSMVTQNAVEEDFVELLSGGHPLKEVYESLGLSRRQGERILDRLRRRLD